MASPTPLSWLPPETGLTLAVVRNVEVVFRRVDTVFGIFVLFQQVVVHVARGDLPSGRTRVVDALLAGRSVHRTPEIAPFGHLDIVGGFSLVPRVVVLRHAVVVRSVADPFVGHLHGCGHGVVQLVAFAQVGSQTIGVRGQVGGVEHVAGSPVVLRAILLQLLDGRMGGQTPLHAAGEFAALFIGRSGGNGSLRPHW